MHRDATASHKLCCRCDENKPIAEFSIKVKATGQRQAHCRQCQKAISRAHYEANRAKRIEQAATRTAAQTELLRAQVAERLAQSRCSCCGGTNQLTYKVHNTYQGARVSAVVNAGMAQATLEEAIAHSTVVCKHCEGQAFGSALVEHMRAVRAGEKQPASKIPKSEYKRRHTTPSADLRHLRFERELSQQSNLSH